MDILISGRVHGKILFLYVVVCLAACSSLRTIQSRDFGSLRPGDRVEVKTVEGDRYRFEIDSVTALGISGDGYYVEYDDIKQISRKETNAAETTLLTIVLLLLVLGAHAIDAVDDLFGGE